MKPAFVLLLLLGAPMLNPALACDPVESQECAKVSMVAPAPQPVAPRTAEPKKNVAATSSTPSAPPPKPAPHADSKPARPAYLFM
jgi:hypothetical protein